MRLIYFLMMILMMMITTCSSSTVVVEDEANEIIHETTAEEHWSYTGENGPSHWGSLTGGNFTHCADKEGQSPVNFSAEPNEPICPSSLALERRYSGIKVAAVVNNGHTVEFFPDSAEYTLIWNGTQYRLVQFHIHAPSEHQKDGRASAMEIHFVHKSATHDIAVLAVLVNISSAQLSSQLTQFWSQVKFEPPTTLHVSPLTENLGTVSMAEILPPNDSIFHYVGSLTTPPCTPGVNWIVYQNTITLTGQDYAEFQNAIHTNNARPVQSNQPMCL